MSFDHQIYNADYLNSINNGGQPINDAAEYGVRIVEADVAEGEIYWRVLGVHHLIPEENRGNRHVFLEALDEMGNRIRNPIAWAGWTWEGRRPDEQADPVQLDKPANESAGNIAMHFGQNVSVWINGLERNASNKSDKVKNIHTAHDDEFAPTGEKWNYRGHHSFYVVFQRTRKADLPADGVISGRIQNGAGYRVRLTQGNSVSEQELDNNLGFRFGQLRYGTYRLEAIAPDLEQDNIKLDADHKEATINLTAP